MPIPILLPGTASPRSHACVLLSTFILLLAGHTASAQTNLRVEPYLFEAGDGRQVEAELGRFNVPANRARDTDSTLELAFVRFPSTGDSPAAPIVYLAGGPGGSGSGTAEGTRFDLFMKLREVADVIAFDQRGTGLSERPPRCPYEWSFPLGQEGTREALLDVVAEHARQCAEFWRERGVDLAGYNTVESADDLEALRQVLGAEKLSLWSISYGTHLALATLKHHPERIERVILAGVEGPDHTVKLPSDQQRMLEELDAIVQGYPSLRRATPSMLEAVDTVLGRLRKAPVTVQLTDPGTGQDTPLVIGAYDVQRVTAAMLRGPETALRIPLIYEAMLEGDFSVVARRVAGMRDGRLWAMPAAMDAASGLSPKRAARIERERRTTLLDDAINFPYPAFGALGVPDLGPDFRSPVMTDVPTLFISGTLDGRTPVSNAEEVRAGFSNSAHLILDGAGHSDPLFLSSPRIAEVMLAFLHGQPVDDERIALELDVPEVTRTVKVAPGTLERYTGTYVIDGDQEMKVEAAEDRLRITFEGEGTYDFHPVSDTSFVMLEADLAVSFLPDAEGYVRALEGNVQGQRFEARRREP